MRKRNFPNIEGVVFKEIPKSAINLDQKDFVHPLEAYDDDIFCCYAVTSNKDVWQSSGGPWKKLTPVIHENGDKVVVLKYYNIHGGRPFNIESLYHYVFNETKT